MTRATFATALATFGLVLITIGGILQFRAVAHLKPEYQKSAKIPSFWSTDSYTETGQRIIQRTWRVQLAGVAMFICGLMLS